MKKGLIPLEIRKELKIPNGIWKEILREIKRDI